MQHMCSSGSHFKQEDPRLHSHCILLLLLLLVPLPTVVVVLLRKFQTESGPLRSRRRGLERCSPFRTDRVVLHVEDEQLRAAWDDCRQRAGTSVADPTTAQPHSS